MACDICGNNSKPLENLRDIYQTDTIKQFCPDCEKVVSKELSKIQSAAGAIQRGWMKNMIQQLRLRKLGS